MQGGRWCRSISFCDLCSSPSQLAQAPHHHHRRIQLTACPSWPKLCAAYLCLRRALAGSDLTSALALGHPLGLNRGRATNEGQQCGQVSAMPCHFSAIHVHEKSRRGQDKYECIHRCVSLLSIPSFVLAFDFLSAFTSPRPSSPSLGPKC